MTISIRFEEEEAQLIKEYAKLKNTTVSRLIRQNILAELEEEYDLQAYQKAMQDYKNNPASYSHDEVKKLLDL